MILELVYLWVEDYKNIQKQGFNFSPKFNCHYDEDNNELNIDENDDYIENFFGDNINVTAIVGKNGSGKSSVLASLEKLIFSVQNRSFPIKEGCILLYYSNMKLYWIKSDTFNPSVISQYKINEQEEDLDYFSYYSEMPYDSFSFFNEELSGDLLMTPQVFSEMKKEHYLDLSVEHIGELLLDSKLNLKSKVPNIFEPINIIVKNNEKFTQLMREEIQYYISTSIDANSFNNDLLSLLDDVIRFDFNSYEICLLDTLLRHCSEDEISNYIYTLNDAGNFSAGIKNIFYDLYSFLSEKKYTYQSNYISTISIDLYYEKLDKKFSFLDLDFEDNLSNRHGLFLFDYEDSKKRKYSLLSYGEKVLFGQMLNYHYRLNSLYDGLQGFITSEIFLIDEPDISLHPMWQKQYIELITETCKVYEDKKVHIVITSHSPFLLSDIPKQNIIFLDKDEKGKCIVVDGLKEKKQTFGANIHTLLSDSFFMEDGLMGEFAKGKINKIKTFYEKVIKEKKTKENQSFYNTNQKKFWQIQKIIGEPFLKTIIKNQLEEIETILFEDKAKKMAIKRFIKEFGEDNIGEVLNAKN